MKQWKFVVVIEARTCYPYCLLKSHLPESCVQSCSVLVKCSISKS